MQRPISKGGSVNLARRRYAIDNNLLQDSNERKARDRTPAERMINKAAHVIKGEAAAHSRLEAEEGCLQLFHVIFKSQIKKEKFKSYSLLQQQIKNRSRDDNIYGRGCDTGGERPWMSHGH